MLIFSKVMTNIYGLAGLVQNFPDYDGPKLGVKRKTNLSRLGSQIERFHALWSPCIAHRSLQENGVIQHQLTESLYR